MASINPPLQQWKPAGWQSYAFSKPSTHLSESYLSRLFASTLPSGLSHNMWENIRRAVTTSIVINFPLVDFSDLVTDFYSRYPAILTKEYFDIIRSANICLTITNGSVMSTSLASAFPGPNMDYLPQDKSAIDIANTFLSLDKETRLLNVHDIRHEIQPFTGELLEEVMEAPLNYTKLLYLSDSFEQDIGSWLEQMYQICKDHYFELESHVTLPPWSIYSPVRQTYFLLNPLPRPDTSSGSSLRRRVLSTEWE